MGLCRGVRRSLPRSVLCAASAAGEASGSGGGGGVDTAGDDAEVDASIVSAAPLRCAGREAAAELQLEEEAARFDSTTRGARLARGLAQEAREAAEGGDAERLCELLCRAAAWLSMPCQRVGALVVGREMTQRAIAELEAAAQRHVRTTILMCLESLDLADNTRDDVQAALGRIQGCVAMCGRKCRVMSAKQWSRISALLAPWAEATPLADRSGVDGPLALAGCSSSQPAAPVGRGIKRRPGEYVPCATIRGLSHVSHVPSDAKRLQCPRCGFEMVSSWYFRSPLSGKLSGLRPQSHPVCRKRRIVVADGSPGISDFSHGLVICEHNKCRINCIPCGAKTCVHGKVKRGCWKCKTAKAREFARPGGEAPNR